jgi:para-aminobenzoate synthetase
MTRVIAVDGRSGAGKTSLAAALSAGLPAPVVHLEDLYGGWDGLERGIDLLVTAVLVPLAAGRAASVPRYDWVRGDWAEPWVLEPPELLVVEGVGAGARRAAAYASLLVWLEAPMPVRRRRALHRDGETFAPYWEQWAAQEEALLAREHTPERADLVCADTGGADPSGADRAAADGAAADGAAAGAADAGADRAAADGAADRSARAREDQVAAVRRALAGRQSGSP